MTIGLLTSRAPSVDGFLTAMAGEPAVLLIEGETGIGKTTLWLSALQRARDHAFQVVSARPIAGESGLAYASLADLLSGVDSNAWGDLADPQRLALEQILLRSNTGGDPIDHRAVAVAFLTVVHRLADASPLVLAIDDLPWLDPASRDALSFVVRRLAGRVGVIATVRTDSDIADAVSWLELPRPDAVEHFAVQPLSLGALHSVLSERLGRSFPRPILVRIHEVSGGNPFYGLELARAMGGAASATNVALPGTLNDVVRTRVGRLDPDVQETLLAAACVAEPTVELVARVTGIAIDRVVGLIEKAEGTGIARIDGNRLSFAHPLLARGVYCGASAALRRRMHRTLSGIVVEPELRARHLALATTGGDPTIVQLLDGAAQSATKRGAPAAAAELLDLAAGLGGDTPARRIRSAGCHFAAGNLRRADTLLGETIETLPPGPLLVQALTALAGVRMFDDSFPAAVQLLQRALRESDGHAAARAPVLAALAFTQLNIGDLTAALDSADRAVSETGQLADKRFLSQALGMRALLGVLRGDGVDETRMPRALEHEVPDVGIPIPLRPSMHSALLHAWTGQLECARVELLHLRQACLHRGMEHELMYVGFHSAMVDLWRGNFDAADVIAEDALERAHQLGGDIPMLIALTMRVPLAAHAGRIDDARRDAGTALEISRRCGATVLARWVVSTVGFLEVSQGKYQAALMTLQPLMTALDTTPDATEIVTAGFLPDAVEALISLGRFDEAEELIERLQRNGRRRDRAWMLAVGARGRAMLLAARGDIDAALLSAQQAMTEHDRLPMPFERARTQLLLGQIQRRHRRKDAAANTLAAALETFENLGIPLWAQRAHAEMDRSNTGPRRDGSLTPSEQRVAELAASGMTNRDVAAALFISPKTVEANLARIYRKLGIASRAELGSHMVRR